MAQSITPIVFSYHPDIDERLVERLGDVQFLDHQQLGFNPMHVEQQTPHAQIDNAGMLRDIFAAMFPDLGDVQLEKIRSAIRQTYTRFGWGEASETPREIPEFRAFFSLLEQDPKPDAATKNILARLNELNDYGVFETAGAVRSLLSSSTPSILRIHATQNDGVQRAVAMLALYNLYAVADCWYPCRSATGSESVWKASLIRSRRELVVSFPQRGAASRLYLRCFGGTQAGSMYYGLLGRLTV